MNASEPFEEIRRQLSTERARAIERADSVRRQGTASLALMTVVFVVGAIVVGLLIRAEQTISRLNSLTETHARLVDRIGYRTELVLHESFRAGAPPDLVSALEREYDGYAAQDQRLQSEIAETTAEARSVPNRYLSFVDQRELDEFAGSVVDSELLETALGAPANLAATPNGSLTEEEVALQSALLSNEFSAPAERAEVLVQHMVDEGRRGTTRFTLLVGLATAVMVALLWLLALHPAIRSYHDLLSAIDHQASEIERSYARSAAAQRIARLGYWYQSGPGDTIECSAELNEILTTGNRVAPTTLGELAALTSGTNSHKAYATYRRLGIEPGDAEMTHTLSTPGEPDLTLRERVESFSTGGSTRLTGVMLDISDIVAAQQVMVRMEKFEIVDLLISGVAHDFNNLLGIITGNAELALDGAEPAVARHLGAIVDASMAAAGLIGQLRQTAMDPLAIAERFVIAEALTRVVSSLSIPDNITLGLTVSPPAASAAVIANRGVFESSIVNLVKNAVEAIGDADGAIDVELTIEGDTVSGTQQRSAAMLPPALQGRRRVRIEVTDNGDGMSEHVRSRALQPFFTTKGGSHGHHMGLGLWSVFSFAKAWDGTVVINSGEHIGTSVAIELPSVAPETREHTADPAPPRFVDGERVLMVEDIDELLTVGAQTLRSWGLDVITANDFDQAMRLLDETDDLALLVTDVRLGPDATGFDLARRAIERDPPIGVVVVSGAFSAEDLPDGLDGPLCIFLAKPFERANLHQAIGQLLEQTSRRSPLHTSQSHTSQSSPA